MKIAVVANGPSGNGQGAEIDACDFVVRMTRWWSMGPVNAGIKVSALAGYNSATEVPDILKARRDWELWFLIPRDSWMVFPREEVPGDFRWAVATADGRLIRIARRAINSKIEESIQRLRSRDKWSYTSSGIASLGMVADMGLSVFDEVHLWGFDKTGYTAEPRDDYASGVGHWEPPGDHDWLAEKRLFAEWADKGLWCGEPIKAKLIWHGRQGV